MDFTADGRKPLYSNCMLYPGICQQELINTKISSVRIAGVRPRLETGTASITSDINTPLSYTSHVFTV
jgi:hypothetical protein